MTTPAGRATEAGSAAKAQPLRDRLEPAGQPVPPRVWSALALMLSAVLFLVLRLAAVRSPPPAPAEARATVRRSPAAGREALAALVERWRLAQQEKDLAAYLALYARTFAAAAGDLEDWSEQRAAEFAAATPLRLEVGEIEARAFAAIAIVRFEERRDQAGPARRGRRTLYLLPEDGQWRIFHEEIEPRP